MSLCATGFFSFCECVWSLFELQSVFSIHKALRWGVSQLPYTSFTNGKIKRGLMLAADGMTGALI